MEIDPRFKDRAALKGYFVKNAIPTEGQFAEFIDSVFNKREDGLVKAKNDPLSLEAAGDPSSPKRAIKFYWDFADPDPHWVFSLNPRANPADPATASQGFGVTDGQDQVRLFIDRATGNVGIGTTSPSETLDVGGRTKTGELSIGPWPPNPGHYVFFGTNAIDQAVAQNYALLQQFTAGAAAGRTFLNSPVDIRFRIKNVDKMVLSNDGTLDINTGIRFSNNNSMRVHGAVRASQNAVVLQGNWNELEVKGRVIDWTGSNLHIGYANDHGGNYIEMGRKVGFIRFLSGGGTAETMRITGGRVGIGTTDPQDKLDIHGALRFDGNGKTRVYGDVRATNQNAVVLGGNWDELEVKGRVIDWTGPNLHIGYANDHGDHYIEMGRKVGFIRFLSGGGSAETMRITGGKVGIGVTNPTAKLEVAGEIKANNILKTQNGEAAVSTPSLRTGTTGARHVEHTVTFPQAYAATPAILVSVAGFDIDQRFNARLTVTATHRTRTGFRIRIATWADTRIWSVRVSWIAFGR